MLIIAFTVPIYAKVNLSLSAGADFSHSLLYEEEILFRTSGRFSLQGDFLIPRTESFSVSPYARLSYLTASMTYEYTRTLGSCCASAGLKARIPVKDNLALSFSAGAGAGIYSCYLIQAGHGDKNDSLIWFGLVEAGVNLEKVIYHMLFTCGLEGEYRRDSIRWYVKAGVGVSL